MNAPLWAWFVCGFVGFCLGWVVARHRAPVQQAHVALTREQSRELARLRRQRRDTLVLLDRASLGEFGMLGLAPVDRTRAALGVPADVSDRRTRDTFGRGNDTVTDG